MLQLATVHAEHSIREAELRSALEERASQVTFADGTMKEAAAVLALRCGAVPLALGPHQCAMR